MTHVLSTYQQAALQAATAQSPQILPLLFLSLPSAEILNLSLALIRLYSNFALAYTRV